MTPLYSREKIHCVVSLWKILYMMLIEKAGKGATETLEDVGLGRPGAGILSSWP